eukprot:GEMP01019366.1.p1 GENE.GEMP01019366.1~~GEMP01019366.1.p1  ORF type:complete len:738 (+),score=120.63 GEMP01019366.1:235-2448(+)
MIRWAPETLSNRVLVDPIFENSQLLQRQQQDLNRLPCLQMSKMPNVTSVDPRFGARRTIQSPRRVGRLSCKRRPPPSLSATNLEAVVQNRLELSKSSKGALGASEGQFQLFAPSQNTPIPFASRKKLFVQNDVINANFFDVARVHSANSTSTRKKHPAKPRGDGRLSRGHVGQYAGGGLDLPQKAQGPVVDRRSRSESGSVHVIQFNSVCQPTNCTRLVESHTKCQTWHGGNFLQSVPAGANRSSSARRASLPATGSNAPMSQREGNAANKRHSSPGRCTSPGRFGEQPTFDGTVAEIRRRGPTSSKNQEWLIEQIEMLQEQGVPKGIEAVRAVLASKCGSLAHAFAKMDYNSNGELSLLEFAGGLAILFPPIAGQNTLSLLTGMSERQMFKLLDSNGNGTIGLAEFAGSDVEPAHLPGWHAVKKQIDFGGRAKRTLERPGGFKRMGDEPESSKPGRKSLRNKLVVEVDDALPGGVAKETFFGTRGDHNQIAAGSLSPSPKETSSSAHSVSGFGSPKHGAFGPSPTVAERDTNGCDVVVLMARWTALLARQRCKKDSSPLHSPERSPKNFPNFRRVTSNRDHDDAGDDGDSQDEEQITSAVEEAEKMMNKVFNDSCSGYRKHNTYLMTRPKFFEFLSEINDSIPERKMHSLYDSQMELQQDLTMATFGFAISEGLNYDSFRVCLHRAAVSMKLNLHHVIGDLITDYEDRATSQVSSWKRQSTLRSPAHKSKSKALKR